MSVDEKESIGVIKEKIVIWTNGAGREFTWGYIGMPVIILDKIDSIYPKYQIVDFDRAAAPIVVSGNAIKKIEIIWEQLEVNTCK